MANLPISGLSAGAAVSGTDLFPDVQTVGVGPVKVTGTQIATFVGNTIMGGSSLTTGYIPFGNGTSAFGSDSSLFWDNTNKRLGPAGAAA